VQTFNQQYSKQILPMFCPAGFFPQKKYGVQHFEKIPHSAVFPGEG
jgi:hypothetical protein